MLSEACPPSIEFLSYPPDATPFHEVIFSRRSEEVTDQERIVADQKVIANAYYGLAEALRKRLSSGSQNPDIAAAYELFFLNYPRIDLTEVDNQRLDRAWDYLSSANPPKKVDLNG